MKIYTVTVGKQKSFHIDFAQIGAVFSSICKMQRYKVPKKYIHSFHLLFTYFVLHFRVVAHFPLPVGRTHLDCMGSSSRLRPATNADDLQGNSAPLFANLHSPWGELWRSLHHGDIRLFALSHNHFQASYPNRACDGHDLVCHCDGLAGIDANVSPFIVIMWSILAFLTNPFALFPAQQKETGIAFKKPTSHIFDVRFIFTTNPENNSCNGVLITNRITHFTPLFMLSLFISYIRNIERTLIYHEWLLTKFLSHLNYREDVN